MPIIKNELPKDIKIAYKYSLTLELICSLHVISDPGHHDHSMEWYKSVSEKLDPSLMERIKDFGSKYVHWTFIMDLVDNLTVPVSHRDYKEDDFKAIMEKIRKMDTEEFMYIFLGETLIGSREFANNMLSNLSNLMTYDFQELETYINDLGKYMEWNDIAYFLHNIEGIREEIMDVMELYYHSYFKFFWQSIREFYSENLRKNKEYLNSPLSINFILSLHDNLRYKDGTIIMEKRTRFVAKTEEIKKIQIIYSVFTHPHLMINIYKDTISIYENLKIPDLTTDYDKLASFIKILSDPTRLAMVKILMTNSLTNTTLSNMLNMSSASISQHLKLLKEEDLLLSNRQKNSIYYTINKTQLTNMMNDINEFLEI